jgi:glycosyltransferase involved in cell wall biosynthesis
MRVSVLIINYNYGAYLAAAIDSALAQRLPPSEIIVVDDGSTDGSIDIARSYGSRIKLIEQANRGHVEAANTAFAASTGDAAVFLDADDILYPTCLERLIAAWKPGISKIQYRLDTINEIGVDQNMSFPHFPSDMGPQEILRWSLEYGWYPWPVSSGNIYARTYLEQVFPIQSERIFKSPDGYLNRMAPLFGNVLTQRESLGAYRVHGKNRWAQADSSQIARVSEEWVKFDRILQDEFERLAREKGLQATPYKSLRSVQRDEYRLLAKRFAGASAHNSSESMLHLLGAALSSSLRAPRLSALGRLAWSGWFFAIAVLSRPMVAKLFVKSRRQIGRSWLSRFIVSLSRTTSSALLVCTYGLHQSYPWIPQC